MTYHTIAFVDPNVAEATSIMAGLKSDIKVLLDPARDGIHQITEILNNYDNLTGIEFISHGNVAELQLGNSLLSANSLPQYASELEHWHQSLAPGADILFYGCNVAAGESGRAFLNNIRTLTGADVAASTNPTGNPAQSGDWLLEYQTGSIEAPIPLTPSLMDTYQWLLDSANINYNDFTNVSGLKLNGNAIQSGSVLRLTPDSNDMRGSALSNNLITINPSTTFQTHFQFLLGGTQGTNGADGFTFMLENSAAGASFLGGKAGNLGYGGVSSSSLAVEFDTNKNTGDPNANHISILSNGNVQSALATVTSPFDLNSGNPLDVWVDYNTDPSNLGQLRVFLSNNTIKPSSPLISQTIDLAATLGSSAFAGFSAGTGGRYNSQDIKNWQLTAYTDTAAPTATLSAPTLTTAGGNSYDFTVKYSDISGVKFATLDSNDVQVTTTGGLPLSLSLMGVNTNSDGSLTATYRIIPPNGTWTLNDNGTYSITLKANQVSDTWGNSTASATPLGSFDILIPNQTQTIALAGSSFTVNENGGFATITLLRTGGSVGTVSANYSTTDATAVSGIDYETNNGTISFVSGETRKDILVKILDDNLPEANETFNLSLGGTMGAELGFPRTATINIVDNDPPPSFNLNFPNFSSISNLKLNGNAAQVGNVLLLTPDLAKQNGSSFFTTPLPIDSNTSFQTQFQFRLSGSQGTNGADGATFILENSAAGASFLGSNQGRLGYGGSGLGSLAVEFDTNKNTWDLNNNNISILRDGNVESPLATIQAPFDLNSGNPLNAWIDYSAIAGQMNIFLSNTPTKPSTPLLTQNLDLFSIVGSKAFIGFSAATGGRYNNQQIESWQFQGSGTQPIVEFSQSDATVDENAGTLNVTVQRPQSLSFAAATVNYGTSNGTAIAGVDYTAKSGTLNFAAGESTKTIQIPILDNTLIQVNRNFTLTLSNPVGANLGPQSSMLLTIADNDTGSFVKEQVVGGLTKPTAIDWSPDGRRMFIAQQNGVVRLMKDGVLLPDPFIDISSQVNFAVDHGLLGLAVHPDFANKPYVYLAFTYDPPQVYLPENANNPDPNNVAGPDEAGNRPSRLIRVTADASNDYRTAVPGSEVVLLGNNSIWDYTSRPDRLSAGDASIPPSGINNGTTIIALLNQIEGNNNIRDYLATDSNTHTIANLVFGPDGSLFVSNGDGASAQLTDPRALRVQDKDNLSGKILRIDPITGKGLADNPFFDGNRDSNRSKVYDYGLRNPFRFAIQRNPNKPNYNQPYIGDVGWNTWEEINTGRGKNFGWPFYEGGSGGINLLTGGINLPTGGYSNLPEAQAFYASNPSVAAPIYSQSHLNGATALIMGDFYQGTSFPSFYSDALFFSDIYNGSVNVLIFNSDGSVNGVKRFATNMNGIVQMKSGPDSNLYYVSIGSGVVGRWRLV